MADQKLTVEESFRSSLQDVLTIVKKLGPLCSDFEGLVGVVEPALENDHQLAFLMNLVTQGRR